MHNQSMRVMMAARLDQLVDHGNYERLLVNAFTCHSNIVHVD